MLFPVDAILSVWQNMGRNTMVDSSMQQDGNLPAFMQTPERIKDDDVFPAESHSCCWTMESGKAGSPVTGKCA